MPAWCPQNKEGSAFGSVGWWLGIGLVMKTGILESNANERPNYDVT